MLSEIQKEIIIKAVKIRVERGEESEKVLKSYSRLTDEERAEILSCL